VRSYPLRKEYDGPMRQIVYALRFRGEASWVGVDGNLLRVVARATGCSMRTWFNQDRLHGEVRDEPGDEIRLESELTITGATTFQEIGTIAFGASGDRLRFSTCGSGHLESVPLSTGRRGAAVLQVDDGERQFAAAHGLFASNYVVDTSGGITILQLGSIHFPDGGPEVPTDMFSGG
jgi:hypothetical protein